MNTANIAANHAAMTTALAARAEPVSAVRARWQTLAPRERQWVLGAALLVATALVWWLLLAPAVRTLRDAPAQHAKLDAQLESMQSLAAEAQRLQADAAGRPSPAQAQRAIKAATETLGTGASASFIGDRATITLQGVPAAAIAPWLAQVRTNARSVPVEAHLTLSAVAVANTPSINAAFRAASAPAAVPGAGAVGLGIVPQGRPGVLAGVAAAAPNGSAPPPAPTPAAGVHWDGRIVLVLPPAG